MPVDLKKNPLFSVSEHFIYMHHLIEHFVECKSSTLA